MVLGMFTCIRVCSNFQIHLEVFIPLSGHSKMGVRGEAEASGSLGEAMYRLCGWKTPGRKAVCHPHHTRLEQEGHRRASGSTLSCFSFLFFQPFHVLTETFEG